jgi:hypothetical protein
LVEAGFFPVEIDISMHCALKARGCAGLHAFAAIHLRGNFKADAALPCRSGGDTAARACRYPRV